MFRVCLHHTRPTIICTSIHVMFLILKFQYHVSIITFLLRKSVRKEYVLRSRADGLCSQQIIMGGRSARYHRLMTFTNDIATTIHFTAVSFLATSSVSSFDILACTGTCETTFTKGPQNILDVVQMNSGLSWTAKIGRFIFGRVPSKLIGGTLTFSICTFTNITAIVLLCTALINISTRITVTSGSLITFTGITADGIRACCQLKIYVSNVAV